MQIENVYGLKRPERPTKEFEETCPETGQTLKLTIRRITNSGRYEAMKRAAEKTEQYLTGNGVDPPQPFRAAYDGYVPDLTEELFQQVALVEFMQTVENGRRKFEFEDLVHLVDAVPTPWVKLVEACGKLNEPQVVELGTQEGAVEKKAPANSPNSTTDALSPSASIKLETILS